MTILASGLPRHGLQAVKGRRWRLPTSQRLDADTASTLSREA